MFVQLSFYWTDVREKEVILFKYTQELSSLLYIYIQYYRYMFIVSYVMYSLHLYEPPCLMGTSMGMF